MRQYGDRGAGAQAAASTALGALTLASTGAPVLLSPLCTVSQAAAGPSAADTLVAAMESLAADQPPAKKQKKSKNKFKPAGGAGDKPAPAPVQQLHGPASAGAAKKQKKRKTKRRHASGEADQTLAMQMNAPGASGRAEAAAVPPPPAAAAAARLASGAGPERALAGRPTIQPGGKNSKG
jgi:hypothetical protein